MGPSSPSESAASVSNSNLLCSGLSRGNASRVSCPHASPDPDLGGVRCEPVRSPRPQNDVSAGRSLHDRGLLSSLCGDDDRTSAEVGPVPFSPSLHETGTLHYRGPHPAHCAAWISVGPMVAIKWGLHTRNHTLEEPHTGGLVDGDS
jgi:hypothetical protein